jgi:hypothetical protein
MLKLALEAIKHVSQLCGGIGVEDAQPNTAGH